MFYFRTSTIFLIMLKREEKPAVDLRSNEIKILFKIFPHLRRHIILLNSLHDVCTGQSIPVQSLFTAKSRTDS